MGAYYLRLTLQRTHTQLCVLMETRSRPARNSPLNQAILDPLHQVEEYAEMTTEELGKSVTTTNSFS